jgi:hypothetical protein
MVAVSLLYHPVAVHMDLRSCLDKLLSRSGIQLVNVGARGGRAHPLVRCQIETR